jgi:hypothetical protein
MQVAPVPCYDTVTIIKAAHCDTDRKAVKPCPEVQLDRKESHGHRVQCVAECTHTHAKAMSEVTARQARGYARCAAQCNTCNLSSGAVPNARNGTEHSASRLRLDASLLPVSRYNTWHMYQLGALILDCQSASTSHACSTPRNPLHHLASCCHVHQQYLSSTVQPTTAYYIPTGYFAKSGGRQ